MIALKSKTSDGSTFQVYEDDRLIGYIQRQKGLTGDNYQASIYRNGKVESIDKEFDAPHDALHWIETHRVNPN